MATPIGSKNPCPAPASAPRGRAFLSLGFRPLYLLGTAWAAIAIALVDLRAAVASGPALAASPGTRTRCCGVFVATIAVGFLMTAAPTGRASIRCTVVAAAVCAAWLVARGLSRRRRVRVLGRHGGRGRVLPAAAVAMAWS